MALEGGNQGKGITFLKIVGGYIWDKTKTDKDSPLYREQTYTLAGKECTRAGFAYDTVRGKVVKVVRNTENRYGERLVVQLRDGDDYYQIAYGVAGSWGKFSSVETIAKVLMAIDPNKQLTIGVEEDRRKGSDFVGTKFYYSQDGKRVYTLDRMDWFEPTYIRVEGESKSFIESLEYPTKAKYEHLPLNQAKKKVERDREDYIEALLAYANDHVFNLFADTEVEAVAKDEPKPTVQETKVEAKVETPQADLGSEEEDDDLPF